MNLLAKAAIPFALVTALGMHAALDAQGAPPTMPGKADPARVIAATYKVDSGHTLVRWTVDHFGFSDYFGIFGDVTGTLQLNPRNLSATKLDVTIPVAKVTVASAGLRDHLLRAGRNGGKPDFFGPNPANARFVSTAVRRTGPMKADITGDLTLNGVTRPVTIAATFKGAGAHPMNKRLNIGFSGTAAIKRSDFGIAYGLPLVSDRVALDIAAAFEQIENPMTSPPPTTADRCGAAAADQFIGRKDTPMVRAELARQIGHGRIRWLAPGTVVTMDYREDRLNVDLDAGGVIVRARCG